MQLGMYKQHKSAHKGTAGQLNFELHVCVGKSEIDEGRGF